MKSISSKRSPYLCYDAIPEDAEVPTFVSAKTSRDVLLERVRSVATACGLDEALTPSVVNLQASELFSPWTAQGALQTKVPLLEGATCFAPQSGP